MADNFGIYDITGRVETVVSSTLPGTQPITLPLDRSQVVFSTSTWQDFGFNGQPDMIVFSVSSIPARVGDTLKIVQNGSSPPVYVTIVEVGTITDLFNSIYNTGTWAYIRVNRSDIQNFSVNHIEVRRSTDLGISESKYAVNGHRRYTRRLYDRLLNSVAFRYEVGESSRTSLTASLVYEALANPGVGQILTSSFTVTSPTIYTLNLKPGAGSFVNVEVNFNNGWGTAGGGYVELSGTDTNGNPANEQIRPRADDADATIVGKISYSSLSSARQIYSASNQANELGAVLEGGPNEYTAVIVVDPSPYGTQQATAPSWTRNGTR